MPTVAELETHCKIADAKLLVAEQIGWASAPIVGVAAYFFWGSWWIATAVAVGYYVLATHWHKKEHAAAWDAYERVAKKGKYYRPEEDDD